MAVVMWNPGPGAFWKTNSPRYGAVAAAPRPANALRRSKPRGRSKQRRRNQLVLAKANAFVAAGEILQLAQQSIVAAWMACAFHFRVSRRRRLQIEAALVGLLFLTAVIITGAGALAGVRLLVKQISAAGANTVIRPAAITLPLTVAAGDSLWKLAQRYGDPGAYQLDRVDDLARANGLSSGASLAPGQRLLVPVRNPVEVARLRTHLALASSKASSSALP